jgi:SAM domain (Sterile alpha motif)
MKPLSVWLQELGLERYAQLFADNDVDLEVLRILTDDDLQQLGVSFGHRKKILKSVCELDHQPTASAAIPRMEPSFPASSIAAPAEEWGADLVSMMKLPYAYAADWVETTGAIWEDLSLGGQR